jgi:acetolactate synthase regulatory subunit
MREGKKRVNVYIPDDLYSLVLNSEYTMTEAIITGLTKLLEPVREGVDSKIDVSTKEDSGTSSTELVVSLQNQIKILEEQLSKAPDPVELVEVRAHFEGLQKLLEEKTKTIDILNREVEGLQKEVERLDMFAHYFKSVEVKQIEAPAAEKVKPWWRFW